VLQSYQKVGQQRAQTGPKPKNGINSLTLSKKRAFTCFDGISVLHRELVQLISKHGFCLQPLDHCSMELWKEDITSYLRVTVLQMQRALNAFLAGRTLP
jgi:hypothetical protein